MKRVALVLAVVLVAVLGVAGLAFQRFQAGQKDAEAAKKREVKVDRGEVLVQVVESGSLQAVKTVEVKSRVGGRIARLMVDEGDTVVEGQLIAEIDPQETMLQVEQNEAQVRGAQAAVRRTSVEMAQRRVTARSALERAESRLAQVQMELKIQPTLTNSAVAGARSAVAGARQAATELASITQPRERTATETALREAEAGLQNARSEAARQESLLAKGYVSRREAESAALNVTLAETKLRNAQENLGRLNEGQRLAREQSNERLRQAEAELRRAEANSIQDDVKRQEYERALKDVLDARAQLRDIEALAAGREQQSAQLDQLRSVLTDGQRQLRETRVVAPITGTVTRRAVQVGELVSSLNSFSAGTTLVRVEDMSRMVVKLEVNEIDVARLRPRMPAEVTVDAFPDDRFIGEVTKISPANTTAGAQQQSADPVVKFAVEVTLERPSPKLKSGMSAKCTMKVVDRKGVLRLPIDHIGKDKSGSFVMLPGPDKAKPEKGAKRQSVVLGQRSDTFYEVVSGVTEGQVVVKPPFSGPERKGMMSFGPDEE